MRDYEETKWVEHQKWTTSSKKWRARDPDEEPTEKTDTTKPNMPETKTTYGDPSNKTAITEPNEQQNKQEADDDVEGREARMKLNEERYAKFRIARDMSSAGARAKSAGPPGPPAWL